MKRGYIVVSLALGVLAAGYGLYRWSDVSVAQSEFAIRDFVYDTDHQAVDDIFHKHDNWYWMLCTESTHSYSIDFTLKYRTSSQQAKKYDLIMKVATVKGVVAGFLGYYPKSAHVWQLLFLVVDQDFRRQGIARKLLDYAVKDMVKRGALRIDLATRNNNFRAQNLYNSYGFKLVDANDGDFVHFAWYK